MAEVLTTVWAAADVGVNLLELDALAHRLVKERGAESCYIDYHPSFGAMPFGKVICTSVNDAVLHGLPHDYVLRDGDLLSLDFAAAVDGWVSDSAISLVVGTPREEDLRLIDVTRRALDAGIDAATVGNRIGDISAAISGVARAAGLSINTEFGGHGVGRTMHGDPHVRQRRPARPRSAAHGGAGDRHRAVVPARHRQIFTDARRLDAAQRDGSRGAHSEHTVAITAGRTARAHRPGLRRPEGSEGPNRHRQPAVSRAVRTSQTRTGVW